ncbi:alpha/beta hydrolase [Rhodanobacter sp. C05]|uniref:alpha/beta hydrolase n=1 Tax=Rhodanobacter sp. C05 TaxID=1945855 RepID=UPI000987C093|nr:alpha/beta hydrolase [Rhodanobacter sp. C05]OOG43556.1 alpha/beta hydrolase [Rhodanobacter sp. C05]
MHDSGSPRFLHHYVRTAANSLLTLLLCGCQAALFSAINATSGDSGLDVRSGVVFNVDHQLALDVYAPHATRHAPVVVFFYGGSWKSGKRQWYRWIGEVLARHGVVAVIPDYRKYPQARLDDFMRDAADAVAWTHAHAADFGGDPDTLFVMGHSAGAHLAALLATDAHWLNAVGMRPAQLSGFIGLAGPYDFLPLTNPDFIDMFGHDRQSQERSQPVFFVDGDEPPTLLLQGESDHIVDPRNARSLAKLLRDKGEPVTLRMYPHIGHTGLLLSLSPPLQGIAPALHDTLQFIHERIVAPVDR